MANRIPLSEILGNIAQELLEAQANAKSRGVAVMQFSECEAEFAIRAEYEGGGKIKVYVAELGGDVKKSESNTVRIKFTAIPDTAVVAKATVPGPAPKATRQVQPPEESKES
jgi:hypothetical protein